jgi:hypothetical protein
VAQTVAVRYAASAWRSIRRARDGFSPEHTAAPLVLLDVDDTTLPPCD